MAIALRAIGAHAHTDGACCAWLREFVEDAVPVHISVMNEDVPGAVRILAWPEKLCCWAREGDVPAICGDRSALCRDALGRRARKWHAGDLRAARGDAHAGCGNAPGLGLFVEDAIFVGVAVMDEDVDGSFGVLAGRKEIGGIAVEDDEAPKASSRDSCTVTACAKLVST